MKRHRLPDYVTKLLNGKPVRVRLSDGYINLEDLVAAHGLPPEAVARLLADPETKDVLAQLARETGKPVGQLVQREGPVGRLDV